MCTVCGCGEGETRIEGKANGAHQHSHDHGHQHDHEHEHDHHHYGHGLAGAHAPGMTQSRMVEIEQNILSKNDAYAAANRAKFEETSTLVLNLVSSPGSGKTTLLVDTINRLKETLPVAVIEGDQETANDAERIRETGARAIQVNTGKGCHLDAHMVGHAVEHLDLEPNSVLFVENVGNLVCPAAFDLGETARVVLLSVTEGDDKPLKYPDIFAHSDLLIISKSDLAPYVDFSIETCVENARKINPKIEVITLSSKSGEHMDAWTGWITDKRRSQQQMRIDKLEAELAKARAELAD